MFWLFRKTKSDFFFFFFFSMTNQISLESFSIIYIKCFLFHQETPRTSTSSESSPTWRPTTQRSWSEGVCTSDTPSGSSACRGTKTFTWKVQQPLSILSQFGAAEIWLTWRKLIIYSSHACLFVFLLRKKKSPFKVDQSEKILMLWCCHSCAEQLH